MAFKAALLAAVAASAAGAACASFGSDTAPATPIGNADDAASDALVSGEITPLSDAGDPTFDVTVLAEGQNGLGTLSSSGQAVAWADPATGSVRGVTIEAQADGGREVFDVKTGLDNPRLALIDAVGSVFWVENGNCGSGIMSPIIRGAAQGAGGLTGSCGERVYDIAQDPLSVVVTAVAADGKAGVYDVPKKGPAARRLDIDGAALGPVASSASAIYWEQGGIITQLLRMNDARSPFVTGQLGVQDMAADGTHLYWVTGSGSVRRLASTGAGQTPEDFAAGENAPSLVALSSKLVVWFASGSGTIRGASLESKRPFVVAANQSVTALAADDRGVYWTSATEHRVYAALLR